MKRTISLLPALALLLTLLSACQQPAAQSNPPEPWSADSLARVVLQSAGEQPASLEYLNGLDDGDYLALYVESAYGLESGGWEDAAVIRGTGASAFELTVLRLADEDAAVRAASRLISYSFARQGDFTGYAPAQADMAANAGLRQIGPYAALFICPDPEGAERAFEAALNGGSLAQQPNGIPPQAQETPSARPGFDPDYPDRITFVPPNKDDMSLYDTSAIRAAWASGDPSGLSAYDQDIYDAAEQVLGQVLTDGMTDLEKETALYSWVVNHVDYDWTHQNIMSTTPRESFTPYGGLVNHTAVCLGYATTFQLLMDLAGVECITVAGAAFTSREDHGWNMVRLDGKWYCVDATWDANYREQGGTSGQAWEWNYFNVTSDDMAQSNHQWDYANTPEAVG